ncbi:purine-binding chemotaxis protein CheW [Peptoclostridium acidaminophilum DSM 3953]|uniref:Purine-binding chemotaxis protein CheW n=1 Tax=Peptoclostridium acidaminophilum DSM 3953 TaxID=1286171 RepID=W8TKE4_PEPAC|nr:chemotaxis protein CheW [Peptoclostridium acidaminophilum]AHM56637.1 purine-binding chemotaxis protein CheW [Peptoclostridium acidaminophilum DSM 3953]
MDSAVANKYVIFKLENEFYGIGINHVETIEKMMDITRVPKAEVYVKGVINLRGDIVPVVDLRERFNLPMADSFADKRIIINRIDEMMIGFIVDSASEVKDIETEDIDISIVADNFNDGFVRGIAKDTDRVIIILDVHKIIGV